MSSAVADLPDTPDLFASRVIRYEQITRRLIGLRRDYANLIATKTQQRSDIYQALSQTAPGEKPLSHGEKQGIVSAQTAAIEIEALQLKAEIDVAEDERQMLELFIQFVA